ncbi:hypothetical protein, partial [Halochromatium roseum]|uniref:hypothetical protein n=1 Tax=Halochromatium roseum TaxID=391920 RepID=UPI001A93860E
LRDYRIQSSTQQAVITGGSAFNIKAESLRLGDFSEAETRTLLRRPSSGPVSVASHHLRCRSALKNRPIVAPWRLGWRRLAP